MRAIADLRHSTHVPRFGVDLPRYNLLRTVSVGDGADQWSRDADGDGPAAVVAHRVDSDDS
jgi:hypothetical protein